MTDDRSFFRKLGDFLTKAHCPNCKRSGGHTTRKDFVRSFNSFETIEQEEKHYDRDGQYTGSTKRPVQIILRTDVYNQHYKCEYCGYAWHEEEEQTSQP